MIGIEFEVALAIEVKNWRCIRDLENGGCMEKEDVRWKKGSCRSRRTTKDANESVLSLLSLKTV